MLPEVFETWPPSVEKIQALQRPETYPFPVFRIVLIETHMSWVFLTERLVYKLKKPVRYPYLDFSTIEARRFDAEQEVLLNRRLAGKVYLSVVPLSFNDGNFQVEGTGTPVDWLVKMERLPAEKMLDRALKQQTIQESDIQRLGQRLASFYENLSPLEVDPAEYRQRLAREILNTMRELSRHEFRLPQDLIVRIEHALSNFIRQKGMLLDVRVKEGRIIEGHGDLRPEHICLIDPPVVIDCLEFSRDLRILDWADELGYLHLESERLGGKQIGEQILDICFRQLGNQPPASLLAFYGTYRACLRAKLAIWHTEDHQVRDLDHWHARAREYLDLAIQRLPLLFPA